MITSKQNVIYALCLPVVGLPPSFHSLRFYLLNALNKPDRNAWIEAVRNCIPQSRSPQPVRKDIKKRAPKEQELVPPHPSFTTRQDTADVAALEVSGTARQEEHVEVGCVASYTLFGFGWLRLVNS